MFVLTWIIIQILEANSVIVPELVGIVVAWLAIGEVVLTVTVIVINLVFILRK